MIRFGRSLRRICRVTFVVSRHVLAATLGSFLAEKPGAARLLLLPEKSVSGSCSEPERLQILLEDLGGTFVKLGQMLALQPDILPREYCNALFELLDRVKPVSYTTIERILREELGKSPDQLFESFDPRPLASASIGQVHVAMLNGQKVAVKIQRPGAAADFHGDLRLIRNALGFARFFQLRRFDWLSEPLSELVDWTEEELDYRHEARYMIEMGHAAGETIHTQRIPKVYSELLTRRVLVAEFLEGPTLLDYLRCLEGVDRAGAPPAELEPIQRRLREQGFDPTQLAKNLVDNFLSQVFVQGVFHADLHPANLLILPKNTVGYIDFGITGVLSPYSRRHLIAMTLATSRGDLDAMADAMFKVSALEQADLEGFRRGLQRLAESWYRGGRGDLRLERSFTLVMLDMLQLSRATQVWPERDVIKYIRSSMSIDGLIQRFAPDLDLSAYLAEACAQHLRWHALEHRATASHWVSWTTAGMRLLLDGSVRAKRLIQNTRDHDSGSDSLLALLTARSNNGSWLGRQRGSNLALGLMVVVLSLLMITAEPADPGLNLFTAQALLAGAGFIKLTGFGRRLTRTRPKEKPLA